MNIKSHPKFIVLEGGEGSGKSSLIRYLKENLQEKYLTTREPGGSPFAEVLREFAIKNPLSKNASPETLMTLMFSARFDHITKTIKPALESGKSVISDRFDASTYAYQICAQNGKNLEDLFWMLRDKLAVKPDLYIYLNVDVETGLDRANKRNKQMFEEGGHFDYEEIGFHKKIAAGYEEFFKKENIRCIEIDANKKQEEVLKQFIKILENDMI